MAILPFVEPDRPPEASGGLSVFKALVDTGATTTCLSGKVVDAVGLKPTGQTPMIGATGERIVNQFACSIGFLQVQRRYPDGNVDGNMEGFSIQVLQFEQEHTAAYQVLLGRDILCQGAFSMSFDGHWIFSL